MHRKYNYQYFELSILKSFKIYTYLCTYYNNNLY